MNLTNATANLAGLGLGNSGIRQIAQARGDQAEFAKVRRVLLSANLLQGTAAGLIIWFSRVPISRWLFGDPGYELETGLLGIATFLTLVGASHTALLRGTRRVGDVGRATIFGALVGTVGGGLAVWAHGMNGLVVFVLLQPFATALSAAYFARRLEMGAGLRPDLSQLWRIWLPMVRLGSVFMMAGLAETVTLLLLRGRIAGEIGLDAAGQFAAAWGISFMYVGFLLSAMTMDYYPKLAEIIHDKVQSSKLINDQLQISVALGGPVLLLLTGFAPIVVRLLYSSEFSEAVTLLQWQAAGNLLKLASWPLSFAIVAAARPKSYLLVQTSMWVPFGIATYAWVPEFGLEVAGVAFFSSYAIFLVVAAILATRLIGFQCARSSLNLLAGHCVLSFVVLAHSLTLPVAGATAAAVCALGSGIYGARLVLEKIGPSRRTATIARMFAVARWPLNYQRVEEIE
jgi:PST family polysaccharide transporter